MNDKRKHDKMPERDEIPARYHREIKNPKYPGESLKIDFDEDGTPVDVYL